MLAELKKSDLSSTLYVRCHDALRGKRLGDGIIGRLWWIAGPLWIMRDRLGEDIGDGPWDARDDR